MPKLEINTELKARVKDILRRQGYEVTEGAKLVGKSGIEHTFDMLVGLFCISELRF